MSLKPFIFRADMPVRDQLEDLSMCATQVAFMFYSNEVIDPRVALESAVGIMLHACHPASPSADISAYVVSGDKEIGATVTLRSSNDVSGSLN